MVEIRAYDDSIYDDIIFMLNTQSFDVSHVPKESMPAIGFVTYADGAPSAAGFLRRVEGGFAQLDGLVTNANLSGDIRSSSIDLVVENLLSEAKRLNLKGIIAFSRDTNTLIRAAAFGFKDIDQRVIVMSFV